MTPYPCLCTLVHNAQSSSAVYVLFLLVFFPVQATQNLLCWYPTLPNRNDLLRRWMRVKPPSQCCNLLSGVHTVIPLAGASLHFAGPLTTEGMCPIARYAAAAKQVVSIGVLFRQSLIWRLIQRLINAQPTAYCTSCYNGGLRVAKVRMSAHLETKKRS